MGTSLLVLCGGGLLEVMVCRCPAKDRLPGSQMCLAQAGA